MKLKYLTAAVAAALTSVGVMAQNVQSYQSTPPAGAQTSMVPVPSAAPENPSLSVPGNTTQNNGVESTAAGGETQTTIVDQNGNLKVVQKVNPASQPAAPAPVPGEALSSAKATAAGVIIGKKKAPPLPTGIVPGQIVPGPGPEPAPAPAPLQQPTVSPEPVVPAQPDVAPPAPGAALTPDSSQAISQSDSTFISPPDQQQVNGENG